MPTNLLTIGEFATLAQSSKRTVLWYEEQGTLVPKEVNVTNGYRLYCTRQIIDLKAIMLLRRLKFSIKEIKDFLSKRYNPKALFNAKKMSLKQDIADLQTSLDETETFYDNLQKTGTLVSPKIKSFKPFPVYYIDKQGPYYKINDYYKELRSHFIHIPSSTMGLVMYEDVGYKPKNAKTKICFLVRPGLKLKSDAKTLVKTMMIPRFKALSYTHVGSTKLLSMLWQELQKYQINYGYKTNKNLPFEDLELSQNAHVTEMLLPIH